MGEQMPIEDKDGYENHWKSLDPKPIRLAGGREVMPNVLLYNWLPDEPLEKRHSSPVPWQTLAEFVDYYIDPEVSSDETRRDHLPKNDKPGP